MNAPREARSWPVDGALAGLVALGIVALVAPRVLPFTTDSEAYLDVAANLRDGRGLVQSVVDFWRPAIPDPLGLWPPLFPALVALVAALPGLPLEAAARIVPLLSFAVFAVSFHNLAARTLGRGLGALATALVLAMPGVARLGAMAWSEATYLALLATALAILFDEEAHPPGLGRAVLAGLLLGLAALTRYAGLPVVAAAALAALLARGSFPRGPFLLALLAPPAAWLVRNLAVFGRPLGPALPTAHHDPSTQAFELARALRWELLPAPFDAATAVVLGAGIVALAGFVLAVRRGGAARGIAAVAALQLGAVLLGTSLLAINAPTGRYLAPALPFVVLAVVAGLAGGAGARPSGSRLSLAGGLVAVLALAAAVDLARWSQGHPVPAPEALTWRAERGAIATLVSPGTAPVLSDRGHAVRGATGRPAVQVPPPAFRARVYDARDDARWAAAGVNEAIWTGSGPPPGGPWTWKGTAGPFTAWRRSGARP